MAVHIIADRINDKCIAAGSYRCHLRVIQWLLRRRAVALRRICVRLRIRHVHRHRLGTISRRLIVCCF